MFLLHSHPKLMLVTQVEHDDVHSDVAEHECSKSRDLVESPKISDATATLSSPVAHDDV